jgi:hypothetical protein
MHTVKQSKQPAFGPLAKQAAVAKLDVKPALHGFDCGCRRAATSGGSEFSNAFAEGSYFTAPPSLWDSAVYGAHTLPLIYRMSPLTFDSRKIEKVIENNATVPPYAWEPISASRWSGRVKRRAGEGQRMDWRPGFELDVAVVRWAGGL